MAQSILEESKQAKKGFFRIFKKKKIWLIILLVIVALGASYYFYNKNKQAATVVTAPKQYTVKKEDLKIAVSTTGKVVAKDGVELSFPVSGNLEVNNVYVKEGDKIKKGDKIASVKTESLAFDLRNAYASYQSALANLNTKQLPPTENDISKAKTAIDQAQVSLDQANLSLSNGGGVPDAYNSLLNNIKSIDITLQRALHDSDNIVGVDNTSVNNSFESELGVLNSASLTTAKDSYVKVKNLKVSLDAALVGLDASNQSVVDLASTQAGQALDALQSHLYDMQTLLDSTITSSTFSQTQLDSFKSTVSSDRSSANSAIASLNSALKAVADAKISLSNLKITVKSREISLQQAKDDYSALMAPVKESDLASARAQLTSAAISVDKANYNMSQATLASPIDGVVSQLNYKQGDIILGNSTSNQTVATIINNDTLFIEANVEESDISKLKVGDKAQVTFDAVEGVNLTGEISFISLTSTTNTNGIVTYLVRVMIPNASQTAIREGMTASIDFITAEAPGVLSVPVAAVRNVGGNPSVEMISGQFVTVTTGFTDGKKVEISGGLKAGDVILY